MNRTFLSVLAIVVISSAAHAHFVWIVPEANGTRAKVVFSDTLGPDERVPIEKIAQTKLFVREAAGKATPLTLTRGDHALLVALSGEAGQVVGGSCTYGVFQRGDSKPALLVYHPKLILGGLTAGKAWDKLPLEIVPQGAGQFVLLHAGKPVADADVVAMLPGDKQEKVKSNDKGEFRIDTKAVGLYGIYARLAENKAGEYEGKKYEQVMQYATLTFRIGAQAKAGTRDVQTAAAEEPRADPAATQLLADARAARATWQGFAGFEADIEVNIDGQVSTGKVAVNADGKVRLERLSKEAEGWAKRVLGSAVSHRLPGPTGPSTPCAFADDDKTHPLGRLINILNDELHSSYRIKDRQIMVVNRTTPESKFSILIQENLWNKEGKYLPSSYVVHIWNSKTGELERTEASTQNWTRVGAYDLPAVCRTIYAGKGASVKSLTLSKHRLVAPAANAN